MRKQAILGLLCVLPLLSGCYIKNRMYDFADLTTFNLTGGDGLMFRVHATKLAQVGAGMTEDSIHLGWRDRKAFLWSEKRNEIGFGPVYYYTNYELRPIMGWAPLHLAEKKNPTDIDWYLDDDRSKGSVGLFIQAFGGFEIAAHLSEFPDFLAGIIGLDPSKDDIKRKAKKEENEE